MIDVFKHVFPIDTRSEQSGKAVDAGVSENAMRVAENSLAQRGRNIETNSITNANVQEIVAQKILRTGQAISNLLEANSELRVLALMGFPSAM